MLELLYQKRDKPIIKANGIILQVIFYFSLKLIYKMTMQLQICREGKYFLFCKEKIFFDKVMAKSIFCGLCQILGCPVKYADYVMTNQHT